MTDAGNTESGHLAAGAATSASSTTTTTSTAGAGNRPPTSALGRTVFMANKTDLPNLGRAPNFSGITAWFNTPGDQPLSLGELRGRVVLVDFWTYSCINCQRALPHVEGWFNDYKKDGFVVVGVSTPEFAFEHVVSNVQHAAGDLGIDYPVAVDDNYATWGAYNNEYWPAEYLIDPTGVVRAYDFGEGGYQTMEGNIRMLLSANGVTALPAPTDVADRTPTNADITPESYVGYDQLSNFGRHDRRSGRSPDLPPAGHHPHQQPGLRRDLDRPPRGGHRRTPGHTGAAVHRRRRVPGDERSGHGERREGRAPPGDGQGRRRSDALHAPLGDDHPERGSHAAGVARRGGLRLHLRLRAGSPTLPRQKSQVRGFFHK